MEKKRKVKFKTKACSQMLCWSSYTSFSSHSSLLINDISPTFTFLKATQVFISPDRSKHDVISEKSKGEKLNANIRKIG